MATWPIGQVSRMNDPVDDNALAELRSKVSGEKSFGTAAPDSETLGSIYFRKGATSSTALKVYIKDPTTNEWWGG